MAIPTRITTILITTTTIPPPRRNHSLAWATVVVRATGWEFLPVCPVGQKRKLRDCWWFFFLSVDSSIYVVVVVDKGRKENLEVVGGRRKEGKKERKEEWKNGKRLDFVPLLLTTATTIYCC